MNLANFHLKLFGKKPQYCVGVRHNHWYSAFQEGKKGIRFKQVGEESMEEFLPIFVYAIYLTKSPNPGRVHLLIPPTLVDWCTERMKEMVTFLIEERAVRGIPREKLQPLLDAFSSIVMVSKPLRLMTAPERWVAYGLTVAPSWAEDSLISL